MSDRDALAALIADNRTVAVTHTDEDTGETITSLAFCTPDEIASAILAAGWRAPDPTPLD